VPILRRGTSSGGRGGRGIGHLASHPVDDPAARAVHRVEHLLDALHLLAAGALGVVDALVVGGLAGRRGRGLRLGIRLVGGRQLGQGPRSITVSACALWGAIVPTCTSLEPFGPVGGRGAFLSTAGAGGGAGVQRRVTIFVPCGSCARCGASCAAGDAVSVASATLTTSGATRGIRIS
jgi:hypothetical protein